MQWMTAGCGLVHAEMPGSFDEAAEGFQVWLNLDRNNKYCRPKYQEIRAADVVEVQTDQFKAKVLAGSVDGVYSQIQTASPAFCALFEMDKGRTYQYVVPKGWNLMVVVTRGGIMLQDDPVNTM